MLVLPFGYGLAAAVLYGTLWASHTLVAYPIVQEHRLTRHRAVGMAAGGTVITDTLALFVLAVVVGSVESDSQSGVIILELVLGLGVLLAYCGLVLPRIGRWAFARLGEGRVPRYLFLLAGLTSAALVADSMGLEGIIGAFFAGLALNRLVPSGGELMESVELVGAVLLIPFFLFSTGMLLDPRQFTEPDVLAIAAASLAIVFAGKAAASYLSGRIAGFQPIEVRLVFGLTIAQAAATLATVTIGTRAGIFDQDLLSAALVVVLVTVIVGGIVTRSAARRLQPAASAQPSSPRYLRRSQLLVEVRHRLSQCALDAAPHKQPIVDAVQSGPGLVLDHEPVAHASIVFAGNDVRDGRRAIRVDGSRIRRECSRPAGAGPCGAQPLGRAGGRRQRPRPLEHSTGSRARCGRSPASTPTSWRCP